ncbi:sigma 54-interacting transcriptional regulator [Paraburkholderia sp. PGU19]|uniref:sigma 54-interacting transcriptional regulator n=1 Tax=Paraburkholderia sp. PGU19 TaxID=2735434 RepID=UPI0031F800FE
MLVGESGTGEEVTAQTIHLTGARHKRDFIAVNCGAMSPKPASARPMPLSQLAVDRSKRFSQPRSRRCRSTEGIRTVESKELSDSQRNALSDSTWPAARKRRTRSVPVVVSVCLTHHAKAKTSGYENCSRLAG